MEVTSVLSTSIQNLSENEFNTICEALDFLHKIKIEESKLIVIESIKEEHNVNIIRIEDMCQKLGIEGYEFS